MNRHLKLLLCWVLPLFTACSPDTSVPRPVRDSDDAAVVSGAWARTDPFDPGVQEAGRFAVQTYAVQAKRRVLFKDVNESRQQVVAGMNFELILQVSIDGAQRSARAKVWRQVDGRYSLTEWVWLD